MHNSNNNNSNNNYYNNINENSKWIGINDTSDQYRLPRCSETRDVLRISKIHEMESFAGIWNRIAFILIELGVSTGNFPVNDSCCPITWTCSDLPNREPTISELDYEILQ